MNADERRWWISFLVNWQQVGGDLEGEDAHGGGVGEAGAVEPASVRALRRGEHLGDAGIPELPVTAPRLIHRLCVVIEPVEEVLLARARWVRHQVFQALLHLLHV